MRNKTTLVIVADAGRVSLFSTDNRGATIARVPGDLDALPNPPSREHKSDKPGRTQESVGARRAAMEPRTDPHQKAEDDFARSLAHHLEGLLSTSRYDDILLFAPPTFLGELRRHLAHGVASKIGREVHKDLTRSTVEDIRSHVREALFPDQA